MESQMRLGEDAFLGSVSPAALLSRQKKLTLVTFFSLFLQLPATGHCLLVISVGERAAGPSISG
jgi:hypothetical protein